MNLRQAAQRALKAMEDGEYRADMIEFSDALIALRAALAEPEQPYDQTALDLCKVCGWRTLIPDDACLNCERAKQPEQKPVAWITPTGAVYRTEDVDGCFDYTHIPLYTAPTPRKPLTDEEIDELSRTMVKGDRSVNWLCRAIERAHGIGEQT